VHLSNLEIVSAFAAIETVICLIEVGGGSESRTGNVSEGMKVEIIQDPIYHRRHGRYKKQ